MITRNTGLAVGVMAFTLAAAGIGIAAASNHPTPRAPSYASVTDAAGPRQVSSETVSDLAAGGVSFTTVDPAAPASKDAVTADSVPERAAQEFSLIQGQQPAEMGRGLISIAASGDVAADPKDSRLTGQIVDRPVWLLIYHDVKQPVFGPWDDKADGAAGPSFYVADLWIAVDAVSGEFVRAASLD